MGLMYIAAAVVLFIVTFGLWHLRRPQIVQHPFETTTMTVHSSAAREANTLTASGIADMSVPAEDNVTLGDPQPSAPEDLTVLYAQLSPEQRAAFAQQFITEIHKSDNPQSKQIAASVDPQNVTPQQLAELEQHAHATLSPFFRNLINRPVSTAALSGLAVYGVERYFKSGGPTTRITPDASRAKTDGTGKTNAAAEQRTSTEQGIEDERISAEQKVPPVATASELLEATSIERIERSEESSGGVVTEKEGSPTETSHTQRQQPPKLADGEKIKTTAASKPSTPQSGIRTLQYLGTVTVPKKIYTNISQNVALVLKLKSNTPEALPEMLTVQNITNLPTLPQSDSGEGIVAVTVQKNDDSEQFLEAEMIAAGVTVSGDLKQRQSLALQTLAYRWGCLFPNSGDQALTLVVRVIHSSGSWEIGTIPHTIKVTQIANLTARQLSMIGWISGAAGFISTVLGIASTLHLVP
ncbi:MAG TPA: hypothetical protein VKT82_12120 [Ktedonobacterales bacterium]|nr:hypothetical protein [Ktedonobacterales bacterium]